MRKYQSTMDQLLYWISKKHEVRDKFDLYALYIDVKNAFLKYRIQCKASYGHEFVLDTDNGGTIHFQFEKEDVKMWGENKDGEILKITRPYRTTQQLQDNMQQQTDLMNFYHLHLGEQPPKEFLSAILNCQVGEVLTFNSGLSLYVDQKNGPDLIFKPVRQKIQDINIENFKNNTSLHVCITNEASQRELYRMCKNMTTEQCALRVTDLKSVRTALERKVLQSQSPITTFTVGSETIYAKKRGSTLLWFDKQMKRLQEDTVLRFIAWADTAPVEFQSIGEDEPITRFDFLQIQNTVEPMIAMGCIEEAADYIQTILPEKQIVSFSMQSLSRQDMAYVTTKFAFVKKAERIAVLKEENGTLTPCTLEEFCEFCWQKYNEHYYFLNRSVQQQIAHDHNLTFKERQKRVRETTKQMMQKVKIQIKADSQQELEELAVSFRLPDPDPDQETLHDLEEYY